MVDVPVLGTGVYDVSVRVRPKAIFLIQIKIMYQHDIIICF